MNRGRRSGGSASLTAASSSEESQSTPPASFLELADPLHGVPLRQTEAGSPREQTREGVPVAVRRGAGSAAVEEAVSEAFHVSRGNFVDLLPLAKSCDGSADHGSRILPGAFVRSRPRDATCAS